MSHEVVILYRQLLYNLQLNFAKKLKVFFSSASGSNCIKSDDLSLDKSESEYLVWFGLKNFIELSLDYSEHKPI